MAAYETKIKLNKAERIYLERRRTKKSQADVAKKYNMSVTTLSRVERGVIPAPNDTTEIVPLNWNEVCVIHRRRAGKTQKWLASKLKLCRYYVNQIEQGNYKPDKLLAFWSKYNVKNK